MTVAQQAQGSASGQQPESLAAAAKRLRAEKQSAKEQKIEALRNAPPSEDPAGPISQTRLFAWLAAEMPGEDIIAEVQSRGISFEPGEAFWKDLAGASDNPTLADELKTAKQVTAATSGSVEKISATAATAAAVKGRNFQEAMRRIRPAIEGDPKNADLLLAAGVILRELEDYGNAGMALARAAELAPDFAYVHGQLSLVCYRMEDARCAEAEAAAMLKLTPGSSDGYKFLGRA
jgi:tetratricopeptide (TPR) repeat protein